MRQRTDESADMGVASAVGVDGIDFEASDGLRRAVGEPDMAALGGGADDDTGSLWAMLGKQPHSQGLDITLTGDFGGFGGVAAEPRRARKHPRQYGPRNV